MLYDLIVIGGGPAGYRACEKAGAAGLSVLCIEKRALGGVCLNEGCIPTKALLYSAKLFSHAANSDKYGITSENAYIDHSKVIARKNKIVKILVSGVRTAVTSKGVTVLNAEASIRGRDKDGFIVSAGDNGELYRAKRLLIATGSSPVIPSIIGLNEALASSFVITSREALELETIPDKLVIIGGGVIGLEIAAYYNAVGSQVSVIEFLDHIAGENDAEMVSLLQKTLEKRGIVFKLSAKVTAIGSNGVTYQQNDETCFESASKVLLCVGRKPETSHIGLDSIAVNTERGAIITDEHMRTNVEGVYAAGDVNGKSLLAHTAYREADVAINDILGKNDIMDYRAIPSVIYTDPELSSVGETESTAKKKGIEYKSVSLPMRVSGRYLAENEGGNGIIKLLASGGRLIGAQSLCNYSSEFISILTSYIELDIPINNLKKVVFPHPTVSEAIRDALDALID